MTPTPPGAPAPVPSTAAAPEPLTTQQIYAGFHTPSPDSFSVGVAKRPTSLEDLEPATVRRTEFRVRNENDEVPTVADFFMTEAEEAEVQRLVKPGRMLSEDAYTAMSTLLNALQLVYRDLRLTRVQLKARRDNWPPPGAPDGR